MNHLFKRFSTQQRLLACAFLLSALAVTVYANTKEGIVPCNEPRPMLCYKVLQPVCGIKQSHGPVPNQETYRNNCQACSDPQVKGYLPSPCE